MKWLMEILNIYLEEQLLTKYCLKKHLILLKNTKDDEYQRGLASMVYKFFVKTSACDAAKNENLSNQELAEEVNKPIISKV